MGDRFFNLLEAGARRKKGEGQRAAAKEGTEGGTDQEHTLVDLAEKGQEERPEEKEEGGIREEEAARQAWRQRRRAARERRDRISALYFSSPRPSHRSPYSSSSSVSPPSEPPETFDAMASVRRRGLLPCSPLPSSLPPPHLPPLPATLPPPPLPPPPQNLAPPPPPYPDFVSMQGNVARGGAQGGRQSGEGERGGEDDWGEEAALSDLMAAWYYR